MQDGRCYTLLKEGAFAVAHHTPAISVISWFVMRIWKFWSSFRVLWDVRRP